MKKIKNLSVVLFCLSVLLSCNFFAQDKGVTVLITGANRGLGLEMAKQFSADGYHVIGTARKPEKATELKATGARVMKLDVTNEESIQALVKDLDGTTIDILINNAGYFGPNKIGEKLDELEAVTRKEIEDCFAVNAMGPVFITKALLANLRQSKIKKLIYISTRSSQHSKPGASAAYGYKMSKAALNMGVGIMNMSLSKENFITVAIAPGWVKTDMGTKNAELSPTQSISKVKLLIEAVTAKHNGGLWYYNGERLSW